MMKKRLLIIPLTAIILFAAVLLIPPRSIEDQGVAAYVSSDTALYREPDSPSPFAEIPSGARVRWISTTADYAFGYIEAVVEGKTVRAYAPWLSLNIASDGTESDQAMEYLRAAVGWTDAEIDEYQMYTPAHYMRHQFVNVEVRSKTHPQWRYYIWLDKLNGGLHDIQSPFTGEMQNAAEKPLRDTLHSGTLTTKEAVKACFVNCYGPEESWSAALAEWVEIECGKIP